MELELHVAIVDMGLGNLICKKYPLKSTYLEHLRRIFRDRMQSRKTGVP